MPTDPATGQKSDSRLPDYAAMLRRLGCTETVRIMEGAGPSPLFVSVFVALCMFIVFVLTLTNIPH